MKKWKNSAAAKLIAWVVLTASAVGCVVSALAIVAMTENNIYQWTKEKVKEYFANTLNVKESDFISIRLATEDDKHPEIPVHHIPEYPYILHGRK